MAGSISLKVKTLIGASAAVFVVPSVPAPSQAHKFDTQSNITMNFHAVY